MWLSCQNSSKTCFFNLLLFIELNVSNVTCSSNEQRWSVKLRMAALLIRQFIERNMIDQWKWWIERFCPVCCCWRSEPWWINSCFALSIPSPQLQQKPLGSSQLDLKHFISSQRTIISVCQELTALPGAPAAPTVVFLMKVEVLCLVLVDETMRKALLWKVS